MSEDQHITPELFRFLRELRENNDRAWFLSNKERYETHVRLPLLTFVTDFGHHLSKISRHYLADPRPVGGSLFRIYRDVRFSKDKSPYKTHAGVHFRHESARDVHAPGFYLHLEPGHVFGGVGIWHPDMRTVTKIRDAIVDDPSGWQEAISNHEFSSVYELEGDSLKRAPRGYDPEHPLIEDLKRKDFTAVVRFTEKAVCERGFIGRFADVCSEAAPFMRFLTRAVGLPW